MMEQVHGVDVSWMTKASPKDKPKSSTSPPKPAPAQPRTIAAPAKDPRSPQGTPDTKPRQPATTTTPPPPQNSPGTTRRLSRSGSIEKQNGPNGTPPTQRRNSWFSNISAKFSSSPSPNSPAQQHAQQQQHQQKDAAATPQSEDVATQPQPPPESIPEDEEEPIPPKLQPTRNAVLQHAAAKPEGNSPYTPAPPRSGQAGILGVFRRLSSSSGSANGNAKLGNGLVERRILNVDHNRERCNIVELREAKLRRVSFCVDVEIAPMPKYADGEVAQPKHIDKTQRKKMTEKGEGEALKNPQATEARKDAQDVAIATASPVAVVAAPISTNGAPVSPEKDETSQDDENTSPPPAEDGAADEGTNGAATDKDNTKKKEKKKRSEEERKARKEKRRRLAEDNGSVPIEIHYDSSDSSSEGPSGAATPKSSSHPTINPARIYRRCCQLRETPILKKITEQLTNPVNWSVATGVVDKLDLTDYYLQLPDLVTLGDYLAVVPVKEIILENIGLTDEGLRVMLAGLLAAKLPPSSRRKKPKHELEAQGGVVERLVLKNNKLGPDGWKHVSLFLYKCRTLKYLDLSHIPFPRQAPTPAGANGTLPNGVHIPRSISDVFATAIADRPGSSTLEMVNIGETEPSMAQLGTIIDGVIKCGVGRLGLAHNHLDAEGVAHVARYLKAGHCEGLDLGGNDISDHIETLAESIPEHHPLWAISLASCNLTVSALSKIVCVLVKLKNFRFIDLSHNHDLFDSKPSALGLLRRNLPKMESLKRMHLQDVNMTAEQAIALVEVLPEAHSLAHINILGNEELVKLAHAKTEEAQEEACALYASLMAAARISSSLVCVDIEVPSEESGEIVKAMAKQVVAYCLRNMERIPDTDIRAAVASAMTDAHPEGPDKPAGYNDVLAHLVGHDVMLRDGPEDEGESAPDEDYVIGGTGVVKALAFCLKNKGDESRRASGEFSLDGTNARTLPTAAKAKDMSKHLLAGARKIRLRLQPALAKARADPDDVMNLRKLVFLDETLQGIIKRFEDEFPDTREPADDERKASSSSSETEKPQVPGLPSEDSAIVVSDGEDEAEIHAPKALSRSNSMLSRELAEEEGRVHRAGHRFRSGFAVQEQEHSDLIRIIDDIAADPKHVRMLQNLAEDIGGELLETVNSEGTVTAFKDKDLVYRSMRDSDPEHWGRFIDSQKKARANISVADESAIAD